MTAQRPPTRTTHVSIQGRLKGLAIITCRSVFHRTSLKLGSLTYLEACLIFACVGTHLHNFMTSQLEIQIPSAFDPFKEVDINTVAAPGSGSGSKGAVHIRVQQRNGRKCLTTVQGIDKSFSYNKILKDLKKDFCCNGNVVDDLELGYVIQLQGDQRKNVAHFLVQAGVAKKEHIKIHGY